MKTEREWREWFRAEGLHTLDSTDAQFAEDQAQIYGEAKIMAAARVWHRDCLCEQDCDNAQSKGNEEAYR